jgi:hypothetical protein
MWAQMVRRVIQDRKGRKETEGEVDCQEFQELTACR